MERYKQDTIHSCTFFLNSEWLACKGFLQHRVEYSKGFFLCMLSESWCNKRSFSVCSALYTCLLRMGRSSTRNIQVKGFSKYASKPDALKKVLLYMLGCVEMLAMIYKNCGLHAVIGERLKKVSKCFSCKIFTDFSVRISPIQKRRRRKIRQESRRQLQSPS